MNASGGNDYLAFLRSSRHQPFDTSLVPSFTTMDDLNDNLSDFDFDTDRYSEYGEDLGLDRRLGGIGKDEEDAGTSGDGSVDVDVFDGVAGVAGQNRKGEEGESDADTKIEAGETTARDRRNSISEMMEIGTKGWSIIPPSSTFPSTNLLTATSSAPSLASPILPFSTHRDLVTLIATILFDQKHHRSLINMSSTCKLWKGLVEAKVKKGKGRYRKADGFKLGEMTIAQKGLVR